MEVTLERVTKDSMGGVDSASAKLTSLQELRDQIKKLKTMTTSIEQEINNLESNRGPVGDLRKQLEIVVNELRELKVKVEQEIVSTDDELKMWKTFDAKQLEVRSKIGEASFQLQLSLARGHIDIERLRKALATVRKLEADHLAGEGMLDELREATVVVQGLAGKQLGAELAAQLESTIVSYNDVCSGLLDFGTRYESSLLLWNTFLATSSSIRAWLNQTSLSAAEITASTDDVESLLVKTKQLLAEERAQEDGVGQLKQLITDICIGVGMDEGGRAHFVVEVEELTHGIVGLRETLLSLQAGLLAREEEEARVTEAVEEAMRVVEATSSALISASPAELLVTLNAEQKVEQLTGLRDQLMRLSQAEGHLSSLPPPTSSSSTALVPSLNSGERVASTLQLWQH